MDTPPKISAYTVDVSICSQICRLAIVEHGLKFNSINVDIEDKMENYTEWYARINPKFTVPAMDYNGQLLTDSKDIMLFLAEMHPEANLYPTEKQEKI